MGNTSWLEIDQQFKIEKQLVLFNITFSFVKKTLIYLIRFMNMIY